VKDCGKKNPNQNLKCVTRNKNSDQVNGENNLKVEY